MLSNIEIDKIWFKHLHKKEKHTLDEIAAMDCVWMSAIDIADLIGVKYVPTESMEFKKNQLRIDFEALPSVMMP